MRVGIGLGSNLGDRLDFLRRAASAIVDLPGITPPVLYSRIYETEPVGTREAAPTFLNAVMEVEFTGDLHNLLTLLQGVEEALGRATQRERNADRTIDLDLLYARSAEVSSPELTLPHPRVLERLFVLKPLADIQPGLLLPGATQTVAEYAHELSRSSKVVPFPSAPSLRPPSTLKGLEEKKRRGESLAVLTAYDFPTAKLLEESGIDLLLVGDSLGMVVLGYEDTTSVTMDEMVHHTRAVARAVCQTPVVADLPYQSYETPQQTVDNARKLLEAGAHAVKLEGGIGKVPMLSALRDAGIPALAHLGMLPQSVREEGGYRMKGKTSADADRLKMEASAVQDAGALAVVLELVTPQVATEISSQLQIPTIGIGAGSGCDGQVLVTHDLVGLFPWFTPKFVQAEAQVGESIRAAAQRFIQRTKVR